MLGQVFHCPFCHSLRLVQEGWIVEHLQMYVPSPKSEVRIVSQMVTDNANMKTLTNGAQALFVPLIVCATCLPQGADATPLSEIGVRG